MRLHPVRDVKTVVAVHEHLPLSADAVAMILRRQEVAQHATLHYRTFHGLSRRYDWHRENQPPARTQHMVQFGESARVVRDVFEHFSRGTHVEGSAGVRQPLHVLALNAVHHLTEWYVAEILRAGEAAGATSQPVDERPAREEFVNVQVPEAPTSFSSTETSAMVIALAAQRRQRTPIADAFNWIITDGPHSGQRKSRAPRACHSTSEAASSSLRRISIGYTDPDTKRSRCRSRKRAPIRPAAPCP